MGDERRGILTTNEAKEAAVARRVIVMVLLVASLSLTGCSKVADLVDPAPDKPCTAFGCDPKQGNIIQELGGTIVFCVLLAGAITIVVRRMAK